MTSQNSALVRTPVFRMSYANIIEPRPYMENGKPKGKPNYNVEMLIPVDDMGSFYLRTGDEWVETDIAKHLVSMAKAEWGSDFSVKEAVKHGGMKWPIIDGTTKAVEGEKKGKKWDAYEGCKAIRIKSNEQYPPSMFVVEGGKLRELDRDVPADMMRARKLFVSGYYAKASCNIVPNDVDDRKYLTFYCNAIMFYKEGEKLGGMSPEDRFGGVDGGATDYDPTGGSRDLDDEIPF